MFGLINLEDLCKLNSQIFPVSLEPYLKFMDDLWQQLLRLILILKFRPFH
jgi:hypothetical protein